MLPPATKHLQTLTTQIFGHALVGRAWAVCPSHLRDESVCDTTHLFVTQSRAPTSAARRTTESQVSLDEALVVHRRVEHGFQHDHLG